MLCNKTAEGDFFGGFAVSGCFCSDSGCCSGSDSDSGYCFGSYSGYSFSIPPNILLGTPL